MSDRLEEGTLTAEVERHLDNLFEEVAEEENLDQSEPVQHTEEEIKESDTVDTIDATVPGHLDSLKSIVLSMEWEISDDVMEKFLSETRELEKTYETDKLLLPFVQILTSLGKYIKTYKAKAHPDAIKLLNSTFQSFSKVISSEKMEEAEKKSLLMEKVRDFKKLKEEVSKAVVGARGIQKQVKLEPTEIEKIAEAVGAKIREMIESLKDEIKQEIEPLVQELKKLKDEKE